MTEFKKLVSDMREAQKQYFKTRSRTWLDKAKKLEREVDNVLKSDCDQLEIFNQ